MSVINKQAMIQKLHEKGYQFTVFEREVLQSSVAMIEINGSIIEVSILIASLNLEIQFHPMLTVEADQLPLCDLQRIGDLCLCQSFRYLSDVPVCDSERLCLDIQEIDKEIEIRLVEHDLCQDETELQLELKEASLQLQKRIEKHLIYCDKPQQTVDIVKGAADSLKNLDNVAEVKQIRQSYLRLIDRQVRKAKMLADLHPQSNYKRIQKAKALLLDGYRGIEIKNELKFTSEFNFYKTFRKYVGMTSKEFVNVSKNIAVQIKCLEQTEGYYRM